MVACSTRRVSLNDRVEQLLAGAGTPPPDHVLVPVGPPDEEGYRPLILRFEDQYAWESDDDYFARKLVDEAKAAAREHFARIGKEPPAWAIVSEQ